MSVIMSPVGMYSTVISLLLIQSLIKENLMEMCLILSPFGSPFLINQMVDILASYITAGPELVAVGDSSSQIIWTRNFIGEQGYRAGQMAAPISYHPDFDSEEQLKASQKDLRNELRESQKASEAQARLEAYRKDSKRDQDKTFKRDQD